MEFSEKYNFPLKLKSIQKLNKRSLQQQKKYYEKFYMSFTNYLYKDRGCFDNYVGFNIKNIKTFFNYINKQMILITGDFYKLFHVYKEEIPIVALLPEELNFMIFNEDFEMSLTPRMKEVKDFFVFGCTVALRVSDLLKLTNSNLRIIGEVWYLEVRSQKTATITQIALPEYAINIIKRYSKKRSKYLLPRFNNSNLNKYLKELAVLAGLTQLNNKTRMRQGRVITVNANQQDKQQVRFSDLITTHTMRRTAITVMLSLGMPEQEAFMGTKIEKLIA
jgi:integrase